MAEGDINGDVLWKRDSDSHLEHEDIWDDSALIDAYDRAVGQVKEAIARKLSENHNDTKKKIKPRTKPKTWKVGDFCNAVYSEDSINYEAYIKEISQSGTNCLVQYIGYGNEEVLPVSEIQPSLGKEIRDRQELLSQKEMDVIQAKVSSAIATTQMDWQQDQGKKTSKSGSEKSHRSRRKTRKMPSPPDQYSYYNSSSHPVFFHAPPQTPPHWPGAFNYPNQTHRMAPIPPPPPFPMEQETVKDDEALAAMLMSWYMSGYHTGFYQGMKQSGHGNCQSCKCSQLPR